VPGQSESQASPVKAGTVTVRSSGKVICVMTVANGKGTCKVPAGKFKVGSSKLTGTYNGSGGKATNSKPVYLNVTEAVSTVTLTAPGQLTYGHEQAARVTVRVAARTGGTPTGTVTVLSGGTTVCVIKLSAGAGSCAPAARKLAPGAHSLVATYSGDKSHSGSSSATRKFTVTG
jgi:hypothetical protein